MMTREIKFRAWEKYDADYADDMGKVGEMHYTNAWPDDGVQDKRTVVISGFYHDSGWNEDDFTVMQYTGLKDKNGKEIYEGDLVCVVKDVVADVIGGYERTEPEGQISNVEWKDAAWFIDDEMLWEWASECEVIGNIYENPDLLSAVKNEV